jgi:hypothetical protein
MQKPVIFTDELDNILDDKVSADQHIEVDHLFELIVAVHVSLDN